MFWQKRLNEFVARMRVHDLPLHLNLWNGAAFELGQSPRVKVFIPSARALRHFLPPTLASLGQAYVESEIDVEGRLSDIIDVAATLAAHGKEPRRHGPRMIRHNRKIDAEAIAYHYDVSNEFYAYWLDSNMVYSCGYFRSPEDTLEAAQIQKIDHILTKLRIQPGDRLLDIGCGWGALALRAAEKYGAKVLGITLSRNQYELARERIAAAGLADRCEVRVEDYRDVTGKFDRITSVGMFEHVGLDYLQGYFARIRELLTDEGWVLNHGITSTDANDGETSLGGGRFIDRYVFPQGELPHISTVLRTLQAGGLEALDVESLRRHYARTTGLWSQAFEAAGEQLRAMVDERRWRIWRVYLAGCQWAFEHDEISLYQVLCRKAGRSARGLPWSRRWMYPH